MSPIQHILWVIIPDFSWKRHVLEGNKAGLGGVWRVSWKVGVGGSGGDEGSTVQGVFLRIEQLQDMHHYRAIRLYRPPADIPQQQQSNHTRSPIHISLPYISRLAFASRYISGLITEPRSLFSEACKVARESFKASLRRFVALGSLV